MFIHFVDYFNELLNRVRSIFINFKIKEMKKIAIIAFTIFISSCKESFLDLTPDTANSAGSFYQTKDQFTQASNAAYAPLGGIYNGTLWILTEMRSDNTSYQRNTADRSGGIREDIDEFRETDQNANLQSLFTASYLGISRCNGILSRIGSATFDQPSKDRLEGEALFLRAFYYFNLVQTFGDVPLVLKEVTTPDEAFESASKVAEAQIYTQIITDLKATSTKLPAKSAATDIGRATSGAAKAILAKVYLTQKNFAEAVNILKTVEVDGGYSLVANYSDIYKKKNGSEAIFEIQYAEGAGGKSSSFAYSFAPYNAGAIVTGFGLNAGAGSGWNIPTKDLIDSYEANDKRLAASINQTFKDPAMAIVPYVQKYVNPPYLERFNTWENFPVTRLADVLLMQAEALNEAAYPNAEAFTLLNRVRTRAGLAAKTADNTDPKLKVASQAAFRDAIAQERRVELAFENHRWFDLVRTGQASTVMAAHAAKEKVLKPYLLPASYATINLKFPYPFREVQLKK
jgi:starch-binding outer membrane protein, SusD/RagB family